MIVVVVMLPLRAMTVLTVKTQQARSMMLGINDEDDAYDGNGHSLMVVALVKMKTKICIVAMTI